MCFGANAPLLLPAGELRSETAKANANMANPPLRVGLLIDTYSLPNWVGRCIEAIQRSDAAQISLVILNAAPAVGGAPEPLLQRLYRKIDDRRHKRGPDPLDPMDMASLLAEVPRLLLAADAVGSFSEVDVEQVERHELDVLLRFGFRRLHGPILDAARFGVWSYDFGEDRAPRGAQPGFAELARGVVAEPMLVREGATGVQPLYRSSTATDRTSLTRTRPNLYFKAAAFASRKLRDLHINGEGSLTEQLEAGADERGSIVPTSAPVHLSRVAARAIGDRFANLRTRNQWVLGFRFRQPGDASGPALSPGGFKLLEPPPGRFWADPFPLEQDGHFYIFFEDYPYDVGKGHLSVIEIGESGASGPPVDVLRTDFHLSFPNVFRHQGELFMLPETSQAQQIQLYRCDRFPDRWGLAKVLIDNISAVDPVVFQRDGRWWMFAGTREPGADGSDEVSLFHAQSLTGPWKQHACNPVRSSVFASRPAGQVYELDGELFRPSQNCSRRYGYGLVIHRIDRISDTDYAETEVATLRPEPFGFLGLHTVNYIDKLSVVDFLRRGPRGL